MKVPSGDVQVKVGLGEGLRKLGWVSQVKAKYGENWLSECQVKAE